MAEDTRETEFKPKLVQVAQPTARKPRTFTRRQLLTAAGVGTAAFVASTAAKAISMESNKSLKTAEVKVNLAPKQPIDAEAVNIATESKQKESPFEIVFGKASPEGKDEAVRRVAEQKEYWKNHSIYSEALKVTEHYEKQIRQAAADVDLPEELALGIIFVENGGGVDVKSEGGALGIAQLLEDTAIRYGMDPADRINPEESIKVMRLYLRDLMNTFGDVGFAISAYNGGEGTISKALRVYAANHGGGDTGDLEEAVESKNLGAVAKVISAQRALIKENQENSALSISEIITNPIVDKNVIANSDNPREIRVFVYRVVAAAELFEEKKNPKTQS